jgi:hypothetical protein
MFCPYMFHHIRCFVVIRFVITEIVLIDYVFLRFVIICFVNESLFFYFSYHLSILPSSAPSLSD